MELWVNLSSDRVWRFWNSTNPIAGLTSKSGFLDNQPLFELLLDLVKGKQVLLKKRVLVSANDAQNGAYVSFALNDYDDPE